MCFADERRVVRKECGGPQFTRQVSTLGWTCDVRAEVTSHGYSCTSLSFTSLRPAKPWGNSNTRFVANGASFYLIPPSSMRVKTATESEQEVSAFVGVIRIWYKICSNCDSSVCFVCELASRFTAAQETETQDVVQSVGIE